MQDFHCGQAVKLPRNKEGLSAAGMETYTEIKFEKIHIPEFDSLLAKEVPEPALRAACGTFPDFMVARYAVCFWFVNIYFSFY